MNQLLNPPANDELLSGAPLAGAIAEFFDIQDQGTEIEDNPALASAFSRLDELGVNPEDFGMLIMPALLVVLEPLLAPTLARLKEQEQAITDLTNSVDSLGERTRAGLVQLAKSIHATQGMIQETAGGAAQKSLPYANATVSGSARPPVQRPAPIDGLAQIAAPNRRGQCLTHGWLGANSAGQCPKCVLQSRR